MRRGAPLLALGLVFSVLALSAWQRERGRVARRAADACGGLLSDPDPGTPARTLADTILAGPAATSSTSPASPLRTVVKLHGVRFAAPAEPDADLDLHLVARESIVRELERYGRAASLAVEVSGALKPEPGGADFLAALDGERLSLQYSAPGAETVSVSREPWRAGTSRPVRLLASAALAALVLGAVRAVRSAPKTPR